jgi:hypothetical protein
MRLRRGPDFSCRRAEAIPPNAPRTGGVPKITCADRAQLRRALLSLLRLQSRFIFSDKRPNLIGHVQKLQPLLFV